MPPELFSDIFSPPKTDGSGNDRKNLFYTLKWLCEEFKDDPDVGVILKTNSGKATKIDRMVTQKFLTDLLNTVRPGKYPRVHLLHGKMTYDDMTLDTI